MISYCKIIQITLFFLSIVGLTYMWKEVTNEIQKTKIIFETRSENSKQVSLDVNALDLPKEKK